MRFACPACAAEYDVPDAVAAAAARAMRCARCRHIFSLSAGPEEPPVPEEAPGKGRLFHRPPVPERAPVTEPLVEPRAPSPAWLGFAWFATIAVILGAVIGAIAQRQAVIAAWPPSARAFALLGLQ